MGNFSWYLHVKRVFRSHLDPDSFCFCGYAIKGVTNLCFSSQIQSSLWHRACSSPFPEMSHRLIHKQAQGIQQWGLITESSKLWSPGIKIPQHTWVSQQALWRFHFSWTSFTKYTAMACSTAPSQEFKSTQVHYLHKPYKLFSGLWTFNVFMKTKKM